MQEHGCAAFAYLAMDSAENQLADSKCGGMEAIVKFMCAHTSSAVVQENGCLALCVLAKRRQEAKSVAALAGAVPAVVGAMRAHLETYAVQMHGCSALAILAFNNHQNQTSVLRNGGVEAILSAMRSHMGMPDVQDVAVCSGHTFCTLSCHFLPVLPLLFCPPFFIFRRPHQVAQPLFSVRAHMCGAFWVTGERLQRVTSTTSPRMHLFDTKEHSRAGLVRCACLRRSVLA